MKLIALAGSLLAFSCAAQAAPKKVPVKPKVTQPAWKNATPVQRQAVAAVIRAQLEAFKRDDWNKAATYQSQGLRKKFGTTAHFRNAIEGTYPQFANYKTVAFAQARALGNSVEMVVRLTGKDGVKLIAIYQMVKEKGGYKVGGVQGGVAAPTEDEAFT
ncbi:DUF4864 domain-containing protein [bacterium]|nr:MAG: DUF4864 domain-containing protein [bacterium]